MIEEVDSRCNYPNPYRAKGIVPQVAALKSSFSELKDATFDETFIARPCPKIAEKWFAIPRFEIIGSSYTEAVDKVHTVIKSIRRFYKKHYVETDPEHLRQRCETVRAFHQIGEEQRGHDILIVPCQFGLRHRGRSVRRVRDVFVANEFGLGAFAVGCMLITHPCRLIKLRQLYAGCPGDDYFPNNDGDFLEAPVYHFSSRQIKFSTRWIGAPDMYSGSVTGFLSQSGLP